MRCLREQFGAPAETSAPGPRCQRKESGKRVEKTEKDVNSKNQPCKHHQSIFIHFLTASILPAFLFGRSPLQGVEDLDLEQTTLRAKSLASGGQQLSGMRVISCDVCDVWNGSKEWNVKKTAEMDGSIIFKLQYLEVGYDMHGNILGL